MSAVCLINPESHKVLFLKRMRQGQGFSSVPLPASQVEGQEFNPRIKKERNTLKGAKQKNFS